VLGREVWVSSTKPLTGHTLGAAGALEAALCFLALTDADARLPPHWFDGERDPELPPLPLVPAGHRGERPRAVLSNSFAFGGSNAALALVRS
jgi:3-oxoacyl-[acyl-carrier-protein] synthase-1